MIYGLGTGRCGTHSLAVDLGGLHEPPPWLGVDSVRAYHGDRAATERCRQVLLQRQARDLPIVDLHQSLLVPLICEVDPKAVFVWLVRHPMGCIASFLTGNAWTAPRAWPTLWQPLGGWPHKATRLDKAIGYWCHVNEIVHAALSNCGRPWQLWHVADLQAHENPYPDSQRHRFAPWEAAAIMDRCGPLWQFLETLHE